MLCRQVLPEKNGVEQIYIIKTEKLDVQDASGPLMEPEDVDIKEEPTSDDDQQKTSLDAIPLALGHNFNLQDFIIKEEPDEDESTRNNIGGDPSVSIKREKLETKRIRDQDETDNDTHDKINPRSEDERKPDQSKISKSQTQPHTKDNEKSLEENTKTDVKRYDCEYCGKSYSVLKTLRLHLNIHTLENVHTCKICGKHFDRAFALAAHEKVHSDRKPYKCKTCGKGFKFDFRLKQHKSVHTGEKPFSCRCGLAFRTKNNLYKHKYRCVLPEAKEVTACRFCQVSFASHPEMVAHVEQEHTEVVKETKCQYCPAMFKHPIQLVIHEKQHQSPDVVSCEQCNRIFKLQSDLEKHMAKHTSAKKTYICDICGKIFGHSFYLILHKRIHTGTRPYACDLCPKVFSNGSTKNRHRRTHFNSKSKNFISNSKPEGDNNETTDEKIKTVNKNKKIKKQSSEVQTYVCDTCGKSFNHNCNLTIHKRIHSGTRPYACDLCPSVFTDISTKKRHRLTHFNSNSKNFIPNCKVESDGTNDENSKEENTGTNSTKNKDIKPHMCEICGKAFKLLSRLNEHKRTHSRDKSFECHCGLAFKTITQLVKHQKQCALPEDGECTKEIKCQYCPSKFKRPGRLLVHEKRHKVPGVISCKQCNRIFKCQSDLDKHKTTHIKKTSPSLTDSEGIDSKIISNSQVHADVDDVDIEVDSVIEVDYIEIEANDANQTKAGQSRQAGTEGRRPIVEVISMEEYQRRKQQVENEVL